MPLHALLKRQRELSLEKQERGSDVELQALLHNSMIDSFIDVRGSSLCQTAGRLDKLIVFWQGNMKKGTAKWMDKKTGSVGSELKRQLDAEPVDKRLELT